MLDFFTALSGLPDLMIGALRRPLLTATLILVAIVVVVGAALTAPPPQKVEQPRQERRIVRFAKWLWEKS